MAVETIFQRADLSAPALINPTDTTEKIKDFPEIAFFQSRVGAPACVVGFEEAVAMGAEQFVLFGSCGVLDDEKVKGGFLLFSSCTARIILVTAHGRSEI